ncbi:extracellular catalytic domain type 1 short-chain-length polyhydroxyalkanoate depolymerase [Sneathiella litorea]|uniref:Alpha/beta fold hydrolase n=1 Tax=Sneathiella litorea TaxID=2606216 RepID=A0A6L8W9Y1_9PROT|nr:alpha/beta fold hydrolase [Sneathiella litorea]MZR31529.1 alpha/beta fold hydrolase [Sneathiella litorea]
MIRITKLIAAGLCMLFPLLSFAEETLSSHILKHDGNERTYLRFVPATEQHPGKPLPLVILLHGGGGSGRSMMRYTRFNRLAREAGFIVIYPSGLNRRWNDGRESHQAFDDVGFILKAIRQTIAEANRVNEKRIFVAGMSNGGLMSQRLACEQAELFSGIAIVTAQLTPELITSCHPSKPLAVLYINGTEDRLVPYDGGALAPQWGPFGTVTPTAETLAFWRRVNRCEKTPAVTLLPDLDANDGTRVEQYDWFGCATNAPLRLYRIVGGGHTWPGKRQYLPQTVIGLTSRDVDANKLIGEFFLSIH